MGYGSGGYGGGSGGYGGGSGGYGGVSGGYGGGSGGYGGNYGQQSGYGSGSMGNGGYGSGNGSGILYSIPPVPLAFSYPGPLPVPGVSWPFLGGIGYVAEGRFPYNGYVGTRSPQIAVINRILKMQQLRDSYNNNQYTSSYRRIR